MRYTQPKIVRADDATLAIQSVSLPDAQKPAGMVWDNAGTKQTSINAYEADE